MKYQRGFHEQNQKQATTAHPTSGGELNINKTVVHPNKNIQHESATPPAAAMKASHEEPPVHSPLSTEDVSTRAYYSFINHGSHHGYDMEHWLNAEAELIAERKLTRTHGYPHQ